MTTHEKTFMGSFRLSCNSLANMKLVDPFCPSPLYTILLVPVISLSTCLHSFLKFRAIWTRPASRVVAAMLLQLVVLCVGSLACLLACLPFLVVCSFAHSRMSVFCVFVCSLARSFVCSFFRSFCCVTDCVFGLLASFVSSLICLFVCLVC